MLPKLQNKKAKAIFLNDPTRPNKEIIISPDIELAKTFVAEGDALVLLNQNEEAVDTYATAENIYWNNYKENMKNVYEISNMSFAAAKASCTLPKKFWYEKFRNNQIEQFGADHPNSIKILNLKCDGSNQLEFFLISAIKKPEAVRIIPSQIKLIVGL